MPSAAGKSSGRGRRRRRAHLAPDGLQQQVGVRHFVTDGLLQRQRGVTLVFDLGQDVQFGAQPLPALNLRAIGCEIGCIQLGARGFDAQARGFKPRPGLGGRLVERAACIVQIIARAPLVRLSGADGEFVAPKAEQRNGKPRRDAGIVVVEIVETIIAAPVGGAIFDAIGARWLYAFSAAGYIIGVISLWLVRPKTSQAAQLQNT